MATIATMTGAQFDALPYEEGRRRELLEGDLIEVSSPTPEHQDIVFNLVTALKQAPRIASEGARSSGHRVCPEQAGPAAASRLCPPGRAGRRGPSQSADPWRSQHCR
jgi:Uma2 family endonuclease